MTKSDSGYIDAIRESLKHLQGATPRTRNGPCVQAINTLRRALGCEPIELGSLALDGIACPDCGAFTSCYSCATQGGWMSRADEEKAEREASAELSP